MSNSAPVDMTSCDFFHLFHEVRNLMMQKQTQQSSCWQFKNRFWEMLPAVAGTIKVCPEGVYSEDN
jgi:hypothetical protein